MRSAELRRTVRRQALAEEPCGGARSAAGILNTEMRGPLVERHAHLVEVGVFVVDAGHDRDSMVEDALGDHIGYFELRKTGSACGASREA